MDSGKGEKQLPPGIKPHRCVVHVFSFLCFVFCVLFFMCCICFCVCGDVWRGECLSKCVDVCMRVCECVPVRAYVKAPCFAFRQSEGQQEREAWLEG